MRVLVKDEDEPSGYHYVEPELHIGEGGKLKGNKHDNLLVCATGDDVIVGKLGNDILHGEDISKTVWLAGNDRLFGGGSNDLLYGGSGNDTLYGGQSADIFVLEKFDGSNLGDQIMDFEIGTDQIRVQADWVKDGWISLDFTPDANNKTVDVKITLAKRFEAGELSDYIEKYDALLLDFDPSVNKITLRDVNYEESDIVELLTSPVEEGNILFDIV
jgi:Ca2+-binding RTX toxin-like protein